ncbi:transferase [Burkholderia sp. A27]|jgi:sugar O-acyltransferase (sialic acid O-acetyltransferase NeuD family)|nr:transferase [Burkholderia sp. A27]
MQDIVLVGSSGHAKVVIDIVEKAGRYRIAGLIDGFRTPGEETLGYPVLGGPSDLPALNARFDLKGALVAIGDNSVRARVAAEVAALCPQLPFVTAIHPAASVGNNVAIGAGTVVMAGAAVNPCCQVGRFCIVNTNASLDHDCVMEDYASLAPGVTTGGNCRIGSHAAVSIGAVLRHGITIGEHSVVGAGSLVLGPVDAFSIAYGTPARKIRDRQPGDKYL